MNLRHRTFPFHLKGVSDSGEFEGYASVFDNIDYYGDVIRRGAFERTLAEWKAKESLPPVLWQHMSNTPLGPHLEMREDDKGLFVRGKLLMDVIEKAREAYHLLKNKVVRGMSIGFDVFDGGQTYDGKTNVWNLTALDLWENSIVTFPANDQATVTQVKSILCGGTLPPPSTFEGLLRDAGFSRKQAAYITSHGYTGLRDSGLPLRDAEVETVKGVDLSELTNYLQRYGT
jgi:HK97 family phage prohead protease